MFQTTKLCYISDIGKTKPNVAKVGTKMPGEIVSIQVGQAGNQIGSSFWSAICREHQINPRSGAPVDNGPVGHHNVFFSQGGNRDKYIPRSVVVDLEPAVVEKMTKNFGSLFNPANFITASDGAGNNFAIGYSSMGGDFIESVLTAVNAEVALAEELGGFILTHSIGGGTGAGFGSLIVEKLRENYPKTPIMTFSIFPSPKISETVVEPYNALFAIQKLKENVDAAVVLDNEALYEIARNKLEATSPTLVDLNKIISQALVNTTASIRFSGSLNVDLRKLITNLVPFPQMNFMIASTAPIVGLQSGQFSRLSMKEMVHGLFSRENTLAACDPHEGKYLAISVLFRGDINSAEADQAVDEARKDIHFVDFIPTGFKMGLSEWAPTDAPLGMAMLANNTAITTVFQKILDQFNTLWDKKAFSHWYIDEGFDEGTFASAAESVAKLIEAYQATTNGGATARPQPREEPPSEASSESSVN